MRLLPRALGFEVTGTGWRAVSVASGPLRISVRGCAEGRMELADSEALAAALKEAAQTLDCRPGDRLGIAVSRPLGHLRRIGLPKARRGAILENLEEQAASIFPLGREPAVVDVRGLNGSRRGGDAEGIAVAVPRWLVEALGKAAVEAGLQLRTADLGAGALRAALGASAGTVLIEGDSGIEWVELGGRAGVQSARFFPWPSSNGRDPLSSDRADGDPGSSLPAALGRDIRRVVETGDAVLLGRKLPGCIEPEPDDGSATIRSPEFPGIRGLERSEFAAACGAALEALGAECCFDLRTPELRRPDHRRARRRWLLLASLAVLTLALVELASFIRMRSRVERLETAVEQLRPQAEKALELRSRIEAALARGDRLMDLAVEQPRWSGLLAEFSRLLPADAYLRSLRADGEAVAVEGYAASASEVLQAFRSSAMFASARLEGPVTREATPAGERERFRLVLRPRGKGR